MRIGRIVCLSTVIFLPQVGPAELPAPAKSLGQMESLLDFCATTNPDLSEKIKDIRNAINQASSTKELADARDTKEYKESYKTGSDKLAKAPKEESTEACSTYLNLFKK